MSTFLDLSNRYFAGGPDVSTAGTTYSVAAGYAFAIGTMTTSGSPPTGITSSQYLVINANTYYVYAAFGDSITGITGYIMTKFQIATTAQSI